MIGKVIKYEINDINTDLIIPARYLTTTNSEDLAKHCMEDLDSDFIRNKIKFDYTIMVAGSNFGCGSSREQAPIAIKSAGIRCVIASSFARIFFRNAINIGLPIIECNNTNQINTGDELEIRFTEGIIKNLSQNLSFNVVKMPSFIEEIVSNGGLINYARILLSEKATDQIRNP